MFGEVATRESELWKAGVHSGGPHIRTAIRITWIRTRAAITDVFETRGDSREFEPPYMTLPRQMR